MPSCRGNGVVLGVCRFAVLRRILQPFIINLVHERQKPLERLPLDAVAPGIAVQRHEADRRLTAERKILTVEPKRLPSPKVEGVPSLRFCLGRTNRHSSGRELVRELGRELGDPFVMAFPLEVIAEGRG